MVTLSLEQSQRLEKAEKINRVLSEPKVDLWKLRELALMEGGLVNDVIRKRAWPKLVGLHDGQCRCNGPLLNMVKPPLQSCTRSPVLLNTTTLTAVEDHNKQQISASCAATTGSINDSVVITPPTCLDSDQIERDVARCTWHLLHNGTPMPIIRKDDNNDTKRFLMRQQKRLAHLINSTLSEAEQDELRYYQGYHDVASIFLSTLGGGGGTNDLPAAVLLEVSKSHLRDFLQPNFLQLQTALRLTIFPLMAKLDPEVHNHLCQCDMEPFFAVSWIITWFCREVRDTQQAKRLFDVFLASHPLMPIYLSVAMVIHPVNRRQVLDCECDFSELHQVLTDLPKKSSSSGSSTVFRGHSVEGSDDNKENIIQNASSENRSRGSNTTKEFAFEKEAMRDGQLHVQHKDNQIFQESSSQEVHVPFQELIDKTIEYMRQIPPCQLLDLSRRYHGKEQVDGLLDEAQHITMFQNPPSWALLASTRSDCEYHGGVKKGTRSQADDGRQCSRFQSSKDDEDGTFQNRDEQYLKDNHEAIAVIAAGFGPGEGVPRNRPKRQKITAVGVTTILIIAAVAFYGSKVSVAPDAHSVIEAADEVRARAGGAKKVLWSDHCSTLHETSLYPFQSFNNDTPIDSLFSEVHSTSFCLSSFNFADTSRCWPNSPNGRITYSFVDRSSAKIAFGCGFSRQ